jgi:hypothetical protein
MMRLRLLALSMCCAIGAAWSPAFPVPQMSAASSRSGLSRARMVDGGQVAAAGFALFNAGYVGQLLLKPRQAADGDPYALLEGKKGYRASDAALVPVTSCWETDQKAVVVLMRSFG